MLVRVHTSLLLACAILGLPACAGAQLCRDFGPQSPRDIEKRAGSNEVVFATAPAAGRLRLCDVHFHKNAEHKGPEFSTFVGSGPSGGYRCDDKTPPPTQDDEIQHCANVSPGDTIEAHWVYTTCDVEPAPELDSCFSTACGNPQLRVETQVFYVTREGGENFAAFTPSGDGTVTYLGSTTGPKFNAKTCSPFQVTFSVPPTCLDVNFDSLGRWCAKNPFNERHAHGVRMLVEELELLSKIE